MNRKMLATELYDAARLITAQVEVPLDDWDKLDIRGMMKFTKENGGRVSKWKSGDGWKYVMDFKKFVVRLPNGGYMMGEDSTSCVLFAVFSLAKKAGIDAQKVYQKAEGDRLTLSELKEWAPITQVPTTSNEQAWKKLLDDLQDVNYHTFRAEMEDTLEFQGIL